MAHALALVTEFEICHFGYPPLENSLPATIRLTALGASERFP